MERLSIQRGGQYREVVNMERWSMHTLICVCHTFYTESGYTFFDCLFPNKNKAGVKKGQLFH